MKTIIDNLKNQIKDADFILVGIGEEFNIKPEEIEEYKNYMEGIGSGIEEWMHPYIEKIYLRDYESKEVKRAYDVLESLLENKNYYIVSTCLDDYIYNMEFKKDRIVTPCGGYRFEQCIENCEKQIWEADEKILNEIYHNLALSDSINRIKKPICNQCGNDIVFNNIKADKYEEKGYLEQWDNYTKWLQGTLNKKLCVIELGVGMQFPTVIRWPFEKIVFYNQKSSLFRIHSKLYHLTEEIKDRGYSINKNPVDFLINRFV